ncbi:DUF1751-domain-containing protein [Eremomyces bilateralis CBS 781.70]|uniref:DUF1751-domain-containing protein n=1 Tax=Eremomyces bilateralis CBS 781.70 TaxID=1392243 RepID=A0A6G1FT27_9PEZI|nr:DUF1751-domain-containing protein [Eremomyces bilateralis CBS 781.70]KAF1808829.1 DUF1751-domain-containing protein [Eremomyces bilateralis CBS 781.70]
MPRINIPPLTRLFLAVLTLLTILNAIARPLYTLERTGFSTNTPGGAPYLCIVPGVSIVYPWTAATSALVEQNLFGLLIAGMMLFFGGRYLERAWGGKEFVKFMLFAGMLPNIGVWIGSVVWYMLTKDVDALTTTISGTAALQAAFLVAFKQLVPEHTVSLFRSLLRIRVKHFPALYLLLSLLSSLVFLHLSTFFLSLLGFLVAWTYLRFFRLSPSLAATATGDLSTIKGDPSDTFSFASFFPDAVQPPIAAVADPLYELLVSVRVCAPFSAEDIEMGNEQAQARADGGLPGLMNPNGVGRAGMGARREEAERRRALALKALDQRLNAAVAGQAAGVGGGAGRVPQNVTPVVSESVGGGAAVAEKVAAAES